MLIVWHKLQVEINSLEGKSVFLFFPSLHISGEDISNLKNFLDKMRKDQYETLWIPFVKQLTKDLKKKFEFLRPKMLYVAANYSLPIASHKYIKKKWNFKVYEPLIVVLNPQGKVVCMNAIPMMRVCGVEAFPFTSEKEENLLKEKGLIGVTATHINPQIKNWVKSFQKSNNAYICTRVHNLLFCYFLKFWHRLSLVIVRHKDLFHSKWL